MNKGEIEILDVDITLHELPFYEIPDQAEHSTVLPPGGDCVIKSDQLPYIIVMLLDYFQEHPGLFGNTGELGFK